MSSRPLPGVPGAGPVYRFAAWVAFTIMRLQRWRFDVHGFEHVPRRGGAIIAANHSSYWDFFTTGKAPYERVGRPVRILAKESLFRAAVFGRIMRRAGHIPVHRGAGAEALTSAVAALEHGELVLVLPEQTIARSFELLPFKTGAARMAIAANVPIVPAISWGSHRFHSAGHPMRWSWRLPVSIHYGEPLVPRAGDDPRALTDELRRRMANLLDEAIRAYPDGTPAGAWWVPARLGGGAPPREVAERHLRRQLDGWQQAAGARQQAQD